MKKGDILWAKDTETHYHPIIFLEEVDGEKFKACILSHDSGKGNIKMNSNHFNTHDENGIEHKFKYDDTHLISEYYPKMNDWIDKNPEIVGTLTDEGIKFIEDNVKCMSKLCNTPIFKRKKQ